MIFADLKDKESAPTKPSMRGTGDDLFGQSGSEPSSQNSNRGGNYRDDNPRSGGGLRRKGRA